MISKNYRLKENEVKKVLQSGKPFFSYWIVLNYKKNLFWYNRFAIVIWWKSVEWSVERNFFRRRFYWIVEKTMDESTQSHTNYDLVFVVKKQTKLDKKNNESIKSFENDIWFLIKKVK